MNATNADLDALAWALLPEKEQKNWLEPGFSLGKRGYLFIPTTDHNHFAVLWEALDERSQSGVVAGWLRARGFDAHMFCVPSIAEWQSVPLPEKVAAIVEGAK